MRLSCTFLSRCCLLAALPLLMLALTACERGEAASTAVPPATEGTASPEAVTIAPASSPVEAPSPRYTGPTETVHHEPSGFRLTVSADRGYMKGIWRDGYDDGRGVSEFGGEPEDWNAVMLFYSETGNSVIVYAQPADEPVTLEEMERAALHTAVLFGAVVETVSMDEDATLGGHPALEIELRAIAGEMATRGRTLLVHHGGFRYAMSYTLIEEGAGEAEMEALVRAADAELSLEIPR
jgi:hypothetical protein